MDDLLQSQIKRSCELALPNGLKELMWDISREVLRAQPQDIYDFITKYLSVLLVTRENLTVAAKVCDETCLAPCHEALEHKLRDIGLNAEDVGTAKRIIMDQFGTKAKVNEASLLLKLMKKTSIDEDMLPAVQNAVRSAFHEQHTYKTNLLEPSPDIEDEVTQAASHTLELYKDTGPTNEEYNQMAAKIQSAYRAYGVRRETCRKQLKETEKKDKSLKIKDDAHVEIKKPKKLQRSNHRVSVTTESSTSLAGSYIRLPKYTPYSAHDVHFYDYEEAFEILHSGTNVMKEKIDDTINIKFKENKLQRVDNKMSFEALTIDDDVLEADDESEGTIEESIHPESEEYVGSNIITVNDMDELSGVNEIDEIIDERDEMDYLIGTNDVDQTIQGNKINKLNIIDELTEKDRIRDVGKKTERKIDDIGLCKTNDQTKYDKAGNDKIIEEEKINQIDEFNEVKEIDKMSNGEELNEIEEMSGAHGMYQMNLGNQYAMHTSEEVLAMSGSSDDDFGITND